MSKFLKYKKKGAIVTLTMDDPDNRNALSGQQQFEDFERYCNKINNDYSVRCVILTGNGKAFSAGGNVKNMKKRTEKGQAPAVEIRDTYRTGIQRIPMAFYTLEVPTIGAINGAAVGAGCDLACMCDIRIGSQYARFAESFVRLGISPGDGGAYFLPRAVPMTVAYEMTFTGEMMDAERALATGMISQLVDAAELMGAANALAKRIAGNPAHALRLSKKLLRESQHMRMDQLLELSAVYNAMLQHTDDHKDRVAQMVAQISSSAGKGKKKKKAAARKKKKK